MSLNTVTQALLTLAAIIVTGYLIHVGWALFR